VLPYIAVPELTVVSVDAFGRGWPAQSIGIQPFGAIVLLAVGVGVALTLRQGVRRDCSRAALVAFIYYVVIGGFLFGHLLELLLYAPEVVANRPSALFDIAQGQSSLGGFVGATLGAVAFRLVQRTPVLPLIEIVASSFPAAWVIGRIACAVAHDHPGLRSDQWFAVAYPAGGRLDLGLLEAAAVLPLALAMLLLRRERRPEGFFVGTMCLFYAPLRFGLDFLRANDVLQADRRYFGATPAQWGMFGLFGIGMYFSSCARIARGGKARGNAPA